MKVSFFKKLKYLVPLVMLVTLLVPAASPVSAGTMPVVCSLSDYTTGALAEYTIQAVLATDWGPSDWMEISFPAYDSSMHIESIQYSDSSGTQNLNGYGYGFPMAGGSPNYNKWLIIRNGSGSTIASKTVITFKFNNVRNPVSGGIYYINMATYAPGTLSQSQTSYGIMKDSGAGSVKLGQYSNLTSGANSAISICGDTHLAAQTITPTKDHRITSVRLNLYREGTPGPLTVSVRATNSDGHPADSDLCSGTLDTSDVTTSSSGRWYSISLGNGAFLAEDTRYAIVVQAPDGNTTNRILWKINTGGGYSGGCIESTFTLNSNTFWVSATSADCLFEEYGALPYTLNTFAVHGTIERSPNLLAYSTGQSVTLTAKPNAGYYLKTWQIQPDSGNAVSLPASSNTLTLEMNRSLEITAVFELNTCSLNAYSSGHGTVTKSPDQIAYKIGDSVTLTATPEGGYRLDKWHVQPSSGSAADIKAASNTWSFDITQSLDVTGVFVINPYTVNTGKYQDNGELFRSPYLPAYAYGQSVTLTAKPYEGYYLAAWHILDTGTGREFDLPASSNEWTFNVTQSLTVSCVFAPKKYPLMLNTIGNGMVSVNPDQDFFEYGTRMTLQAIPSDESWWFERWVFLDHELESNSAFNKSANTATIWVDRPIVVNAEFSNTPYIEIIPPDHGWSYASDSNGLICASIGNYPLVGPLSVDAVVTAKPDDGWKFDHWEYEYLVNGQFTDLHTSDADQLQLTVNRSTRVKAVFTNLFHVEVSCSGNGHVDHSSGDYTIYTGTTFQAIPDTGWHFIRWDITFEDGSQDKWDLATLYIGEYSKDMSVKAVFERFYTTFNITAENGTVQIDPVAESYDSLTNNSVTFTAVPNDGWKFDHWHYSFALPFGSWANASANGISFDSTSNPLNLDIYDDWTGNSTDITNGPVNMTAYFVQDAGDGYTLTVNRAGNGSAAKNPLQTSYAPGEEVAITATPDAGYHFVNWTGDTAAIIRDSSSGSITIIMNGNYILQANFANDVPVISDIADQTTPEDTNLIVPFSIGDTETATDSLALSKGSSNTVLVPLSNIVLAGSGPDHSVTIAPTPDRFGTATITLTVNDGHGQSISDTFELSVSPVNDAPFGADRTVTIGKDKDYIFTTGDFGFTDLLDSPANLFKAVKIVTLPESGILSSNGAAVTAGQFIPASDISGEKLKFTPAADADEIGYAYFTFQVQDDGGMDNGGVDLDQTPNILTIDVVPSNHAPSFTAGSNQESAEDSGSQTVSAWATDISAGPENESGQTLNFNVDTDNPELFSNQPAISVSGDLTYTPAADTSGIANVTVSLQDDGGTNYGGTDISAIQSFTITIIPVNDKPTAEAQNLSTNEDIPLFITLGGSDAETTELEFTVLNGPEAGALSAIMDASSTSGVPNTDSATLTYTPPADYYGSVSFTYQVRDSGDGSSPSLDSDPVTINITVNPVNDAPIFTAGSNQESAEDSGAQTVSGWAIDINGGPENESEQSLHFVTVCDNTGLFSQQPAIDAISGDLTYTPAADACGIANVTVSLQDDGGTNYGGTDISAVKSFTITITSVNDIPIASDQDLNTAEDTPLEITLNGSDPETIDLNFVIVDKPGQGILSEITDEPGIAGAPNTDTAIVIYTPPADYCGTVSFTYRVKEEGDSTSAGLESDSATVSLTVNAVNDAPVDVNLSNDVINENLPAGAAIGILSTIDIDSADVFTYSLVNGTGDTDNTRFEINGNTLLTKAVLDYETQASYSIVVQSTDQGGLFCQKPLTITLNNLPEYAPIIIIEPVSRRVEAGDPVTFTVIAEGNPIPSIQWQVSKDSGSTWSDISEANSSSYTIQRVNSTMDGYLYRAILTNLEGSITTKTAKLRVTPYYYGEGSGNTNNSTPAATNTPHPTLSPSPAPSSGSIAEVPENTIDNTSENINTPAQTNHEPVVTPAPATQDMNNIPAVSISPTPSTETPITPSTNWWWIIGIILAAMMSGGILIYIIRKNRASA